MDAVLAYLHFSDQRDLVRLRAQVSSKECELLRVLTKNHLGNHNLTAQQLLEMEYLGSPSSIHALIKRLMSKKMVLALPDQNDSQMKHLIPSPKALGLLSELGKLINLNFPNSESQASSYSIVEIENLSMMNAS